jgi:hypothetical protein
MSVRDFVLGLIVLIVGLAYSYHFSTSGGSQNAGMWETERES